MSGIPSVIAVDRLRADLAARRSDRETIVGRRVEFHPRLDSTNDRARELAASGEPEGTVVLADAQARGRGRGDRSWHSPPGLGVYLSVILRPEAPAAAAPLFGLLASVAAADAFEASIKWPNDVMIAGRKVAGILTEARTSLDAIRDLVVGVGVNVNHEECDFPGSIAHLATSLRLARGRTLDRTDVACDILTALDEWYNLWSREGPAPIRKKYERLAEGLSGRRVVVGGGNGSFTGVTEGLTEDAALRVRRDGGAGEVVEVRYGEVRRVEAR